MSRAVRTLNADWFVYFWHLDNIIDENIDAMDPSQMAQISESLREIWHADPISVSRLEPQTLLDHGGAAGAWRICVDSACRPLDSGPDSPPEYLITPCPPQTQN